MALAGLALLVASTGCSGGYGPGPEINDGGRQNWPDGIDLDAWRTISDAHPTDSACSGMGMQCGAAAVTVHPSAGTCTYLLPCELLGADRLHVLSDGVELPRSVPDGSSWRYADASQTAIVIDGPLCQNIIDGTATADLMITGACGPIP